MKLDLPDYIKLVKAAYKQVKADGIKPQLANPTRGGIRGECLLLYNEGLEKRDEPILRAFFGVPDQGGDFFAVINNFETEDYKALQNYMNGTSKTTEHKNIELLAWLIDFKHRPFKSDNNVQLTEEEKIILGITAPPVLTPPKQPPPKATPGTGSKEPPLVKEAWISRLKKGAAVLITGTVLSGGIYMIMSGKETTGCMYWTGDHYEKISCNEKPNGRNIVQFDDDQFEIQKINRQDTINEQHIGKLYYIKEKNEIQYFTRAGQYPEDMKRELQKLSQLIFNKYLDKKADSATNAIADKSTLK